MTKPIRPSAEIRADIAATEARVSEIDKRLDAIDVEIRTLKKERDTLFDLWGRRGKIDALRAELAVAECAEGDATLPRIRVDNGSGHTVEVVVTRVTKKRIYTRPPGSEYEDRWTHAGKPESGWVRSFLLDLDRIADLIAKAGAK